MTAWNRLPGLRRSLIQHTTLRVELAHPSLDWCNMRDGETWSPCTQVLPGVQLTMPAQDFEHVVDVLQAHHHAVSTCAAVQDAWNQYRMLLAMTRPEHTHTAK